MGKEAATRRRGIVISSTLAGAAVGLLVANLLFPLYRRADEVTAAMHAAMALGVPIVAVMVGMIVDRQMPRIAERYRAACWLILIFACLCLLILPIVDRAD